MSNRSRFALTWLWLVAASAAHAQTTISYPNFSSTAGLNLNGSAAAVTTGDGVVLRLTPALGGRSGSAFSNTKITLGVADSFSVFFQFRLTNPGYTSADGLTFVVQPVSASLGGGGGGIGYAGISPSVAVEFDTYDNGELNDNHVAVDVNGGLQNFATAAPYGVNGCYNAVGVPGCMANGRLWSVWIDYDGTRLHVAVADNSTIRPADLISYPIDIAATLDTNAAYVGFTAGTGAAWENHDIVNWQFVASYAPIVGPSSMVISPATLPVGYAGISYSALMAVTGGTAPYTWSSANLPAGMSITPDGLINGAPIAASTYTNVVITVKDASNATASRTYTILVNPGLVPLYITGSGNMGSVAVGKPAQSVSFSASGGKPPYSWRLSGAPAGIDISVSGSGATASGTPLSAGVFLFTVQVTDAQGLSVAALGSVSVLGLATSSLPEATAFATYVGTLIGTGGSTPYSYVVSGLPTGLSVTGDGQFRGQPEKAGTFVLGVRITDSAGLVAAGSLSLRVNAPPTLTLPGAALTAALVNTGYSQSVTATGGAPPYTFALASGLLPGGMRFSSSGTLSGVPANPGAFSFTVRVTDRSGGSATGSFNLVVAAPPVVLNAASPLAGGMISIDYQQALGATGGVPPYSFAATGGTLPDGLSLSPTGIISGTPKAAGQFTFEATATDSTGQTGKAAYLTAIRPTLSDLILSAGSLVFTLPAGGAPVSPPQTVQVQSSDVSKVLPWSARTGATWLTVFGGASTPGNFSVSLSNAASALAAADAPYQSNIVVTCSASPCTGSTQIVSVQLIVKNTPAQLTVGTDSVVFSTSAAAPLRGTQNVSLGNPGGGSLGIGSVTCGAPWCTVSGIPGQIGPAGSTAIPVNANPEGLNPGYYWTPLSIVTSAGRSTIPVSLFIAGNPGLTLAPAGYQASLQTGGVLSVPPTSFLVTVPSVTPVNWTATIEQGGFLRLIDTAGTANASQPGKVKYVIDPSTAASLAPGIYYGLIRIKSTGAANSPQDFVVVLNVTTASEKPRPNPAPAGLLFLTSAGSTPLPQAVTLYNSSSLAQGWQASAETFDGAGWLAVTPPAGTTLAADPAATFITVDPSKLGSGIYRGAVNYAFAAIGVRSVNVTLVVLQAGLAQEAAPLQPRAQCSPTLIAPTSTGLVNNFSAPTAWPTPLELTVVNDCGQLETGAQIVATFSNGDPPLAIVLADPATGRYSATWTPRRASSQVVIAAQARVAGLPVANVQLSGAVTPNNAPTVNRGGVLSLYNPESGAPAAPGTLLQIGGTYLAAQAATSNANPLPKTLGGTSVLIGGLSAPVVSVSPGQVNVQAPFELIPGQPYQVIVSANGSLTTPETVQFAPTAPGLALVTAGLVKAIHQKGGAAITQISPARPGEAISVFLTGLGLTDTKVESGAGGPDNPPANVVLPASVTLDSVVVTPSFAGLAPGQPGVYQIDFTVPDNANSGQLPLQVTQGGVSTNQGLLPVQK